MDPCIGKMLVMGATFGCLEPVLTIAAGMAYRDPFVMPIDKKELADEVKREFSNGTRSDHIALLNAYDAWQQACQEGHGCVRGGLPPPPPDGSRDRGLRRARGTRCRGRVLTD